MDGNFKIGNIGLVSFSEFDLSSTSVLFMYFVEETANLVIAKWRGTAFFFEHNGDNFEVFMDQRISFVRSVQEVPH